jgi:hypothetical protein
MEIFTEKGYNTRQAYDPDVVSILGKNAWQDLHLEGRTFTPVPRVKMPRTIKYEKVLTNKRLYFVHLLEVAM